MKPILYPDSEMNFTNNGVGVLSDGVSCYVDAELNGMYELEMTYPASGLHFSAIQYRSLILARPDPISQPQPFRVYRITKALGGLATVYARHLAYDLMGIVTAPFSASGAQAALQGLSYNAVTDCPFAFYTDKTTQANRTVAFPMAIWSQLGGTEGSILDIFGGEYEFDRWTVALHSHRGENRGVSIRYGKNLTTLEQDENCANCYTGVYPYWVSQEGALTQLPEKIVAAEGNFGYVKIFPLDLSQEWQESPTMEQLRSRAQRYIKDNKIGVPTVSWEVGFLNLEQTEEYKGKDLLERVLLGDTVSVIFSQMGVNASARAVKTRYNVLLDRYESVTLGSVKANIADTIVKQQNAIEAIQPRTNAAIQAAVTTATAWLTNGKGYKVERRDAEGNTVDTLYMDDPNIETAQHVLRIGQSGIGFSHTGVNGPYVNAWTIDGTFNADFILAGTLYGILVKAGRIESADGKIVIDLSSTESSAMPRFNTGISTNGLHVRGDEAGADTIMSIRAIPKPGGGFFATTEMFGAAGNLLMRITENFDTTSGVWQAQGGTLAVYANDGITTVGLASTTDRAGVFAEVGGESIPLVGIDASARPFVNAEILNGRAVTWRYSYDLGAYVLVGS